METATMTLVEFLTARLDEDEQWARESSRREGRYTDGGEHWHWVCPQHDEPVILDPLTSELPRCPRDPDDWNVSLRSVEEYPTTSGVGPLPSFVVDNAEVSTVRAAHIARHDPVHVLREVESKRRIIELAILPAHQSWTSPWVDALVALGSVYSDHPDYRPAWAEMSLNA